jgi:hypothetical protein
MLCLSVAANAAAGETAAVSMRTSQDSLTLGEHIHVIVTVQPPRGHMLEAPDPDTAFGERITCLQWHRDSETDTAAARAAHRFTYVVTTYHPRPCTIPALSYVTIRDSLRDTLHTRPYPLQVASVVTGDSADIKGLKPLFAAGERSWWWVWLLCGGVLCGTGLIFLLHILRKRRKTAHEPPPPPPYDEAIEALQRLERQNLLDKGMIQPFVFSLSHILRRYIGRVYGVAAQEYTTEEMLRWLAGAPVPAEAKKRLGRFFDEVAPVKYARFIPPRDTLIQCMNTVWWFVDYTRPSNRAHSESQEATPQGPAGAGPARTTDPAAHARQEGAGEHEETSASQRTPQRKPRRTDGAHEESNAEAQDDTVSRSTPTDES